ncbi:Ku-like dsDNA break binding protein [Arthrobacter phage Shoya]|uniref:Ku-like dsDNA break binding protein n=1 Tax=Arthrobacter phage Shoya TaxID=2704035 RepID=A0A6G6XIP7_9CAUD|nr:Ku-like dsDNA break binding protein [Arthrobacter phage Shoya]QIG57725.1 Ku-like dsDNA break binding protein [Arthrobacter phage Shoya]
MTELKDKNLRFLLMKTLADLVAAEVGDARGELMEDLLGQFDDLGVKSFTVKIPGAEKVATFTIAEPKPTTKVDGPTLLDWCRANRPELTKVIEHPAKEAWEEVVLADDALKVLSDELALAGEDFYTTDGEQVPGLKYVAAGRPKSFSVKYEKGGQDRVIQAWRDGDLAGIEPGRNLPSIGAAHA